MNRINKIIRDDSIAKSAIGRCSKNTLHERQIPQTPQAIDNFIADNEWIMHAAIRPYRGLLENEDLFQEACVGVVKGLNTFNPNKEVKLTTYVYACAVNEVKMAIRKNNAKKRSATVVSIDSSPLDQIMGNPRPLDTPDSNTDVEKDVLESVLYNNIMRVVKTKLTTIEQIVVIQYKDGVPQSKTSKYLHISQSQVSKILNQAFCKIKSEIGPIGINS